VLSKLAGGWIFDPVQKLHGDQRDLFMRCYRLIANVFATSKLPWLPEQAVCKARSVMRLGCRFTSQP